jgi:carbon storage regulator
MLVLTRKTNESIMIGDQVEIVIVDIHGDQVKVGIRAPREVAVHRKEVYDEIKKANISAVQDKKPKLTGFSSLLRDKNDVNKGNDNKG